VFEVKAVKLLLILAIAVGMGATGLSLVKVIDVQRDIGLKQAALVEKVERQNDSIVNISGAFKSTEEMVAKTSRMLADLKSLTSVVSDMNGLVSRANGLQVATDRLLGESNDRIGGLRTAASSVQEPLQRVRSLTAVTLDFINRTVSSLSAMAGQLASTNQSAAGMADMMEGNY
jgi:hypothetical protein